MLLKMNFHLQYFFLFRCIRFSIQSFFVIRSSFRYLWNCRWPKKESKWKKNQGSVFIHFLSVVRSKFFFSLATQFIQHFISKYFRKAKKWGKGKATKYYLCKNSNFWLLILIVGAKKASTSKTLSVQLKWVRRGRRAEKNSFGNCSFRKWSWTE